MTSLTEGLKQFVVWQERRFLSIVTEFAKDEDKHFAAHLLFQNRIIVE
jgi:hypothetical protein